MTSFYGYYPRNTVLFEKCPSSKHRCKKKGCIIFLKCSFGWQIYGIKWVIENLVCLDFTYICIVHT